MASNSNGKLLAIITLFISVLLSTFLISCSAGSSSGTSDEPIDIGPFKNVSNLMIHSISMVGDEATAEEISFEVPYERLPWKDKLLVDNKKWYKSGDVIRIHYINSTGNYFIVTPSGELYKSD